MAEPRRKRRAAATTGDVRRKRAPDTSLPFSDVPPPRFGRQQMSRLGEILASDGMIVFMLAVVVVEATVLMVWHRRTAQGPEPVQLMSFLGAGAALMAAMFFVKRIKRSALPFATALLASLIFHIWHVTLLWGR